MANITRRPGPQQQQGRQVARPRGWGARLEPYQIAQQLLGFDPFGQMGALPSLTEPSFVPRFDVKETKDGYEFHADLPGVSADDLEISVEGDRLTVSGKREEEERVEEDTYYAYERAFGSFTRSFTLPAGADLEHVKADLRDGVLSLMIPKKPEVMPKKVEIKPSGGKQAQPAKA